MGDLVFLWGYSLHRVLGLVLWFFVAVALGRLLQHMRMDVLTSGSLRRRNAAAVVGTTVFGAFTPFCACSIVPLIRSVLAAGVPVSVVMSFWIASPVMAPEEFGLTAKVFGMKLAVVRLIGALALGIAASIVARIMENRGLLDQVMRESKKRREVTPAAAGCCDAQASAPASSCGSRSCSVSPAADPSPAVVIRASAVASADGDAVLAPPGGLVPLTSCCDAPADPPGAATGGAAGTPPVTDGQDAPASWWRLATRSLHEVRPRDFAREMAGDTWTLGRWMLLGVIIEALIVRFVPPATFKGELGGNVLASVVIAAFLSIPLYLNGVSAIPVGAGLITMGMSPAGLTTFLLAGAITTIPAMTGVRAVVSSRVFALYVGTGIVGSILVGLIAAPFLT